MALLPVHTASRDPVLLPTFPGTIQGVIQSDLNYSVVLKCLTAVSPDPVLHWTLNGQPCGTGSMLIIQKLSWEHLGTYMCTAKNSQEEHSSKSVTISLSQGNVDPTDAEPIEPNPIFSLSGRSAMALVIAGNLGILIVIAGMGFTIIQSQRTDRQRIRICS
ncbi:immunoglobulin superfamily member 23 [Pteropus vampyrus]|uniref:immunoglobulin superfamily member 23 n=1 Tax=Pteropus vampyrus TaxID=132908 RepID=UPI000C876486|nr:immunoglobulin superfamily member 23 [Pteropus vampyrus]